MKGKRMKKEKNNQRETYKQYAEKRASKSPLGKNCLFAFLIGGTICLIGQLLTGVYVNLGLSEDLSYLLASVTLIFFAILLTGMGVFDKIASCAGAGTLVPITGFANSIVSPAMEFKNDGFVMGVGAKMFVIAGPVIVYGTISSIIVGLLHYISL